MKHDPKLMDTNFQFSIYEIYFIGIILGCFKWYSDIRISFCLWIESKKVSLHLFVLSVITVYVVYVHASNLRIEGIPDMFH
jgi:hypothetical protein